MKPDPSPENPSQPSKASPEVPFPISALPPRLGAMVRSVGELCHVPDVMPAVIALAMVSSIMGKGLRVASLQGRKTMGNLFFLISAGSGTGKSTVLRIMSEALYLIQAHLAQYGRRWELWAQGRQSKCSQPGFEGFAGIEGDVGILPPESKLPAASASDDDDDEPKDPRMICSEATGRALAKLLLDNHQMILNATAEAGNLLDEAGKVNGDFGQLLLKGFSGDHVQIDRVTRAPIVMEEPCISVCWLCQPHRLEKFLSSDRLLEDGLLARFLVAHSKASMARIAEHDRGTVPIAIADDYGALLEELFVHYGWGVSEEWVVESSPAAASVLREYHNSAVDQWHADEGPLRSCIARWTEQAWKIALVLHAATHGRNAHQTVLSEETARNAVLIHQWFAAQQAQIINGGPLPSVPRVDARLKKLLELLADSPGGAMTLRDLKNSHGFTDEEVRAPVKSVPERLQIQKLQNPKGGRASHVVNLLNPSL